MNIGFLGGALVGLAMGVKIKEKRQERIRELMRRLRQMPPVAQAMDAAGEKAGELVRLAGRELTERAVDRVKYGVFGMDNPLVIESAKERVEKVEVIVVPEARKEIEGKGTGKGAGV